MSAEREPASALRRIVSDLAPIEEKLRQIRVRSEESVPGPASSAEARLALVDIVAAARRRRDLPRIDLGEPCWDMLLDLYAAGLRKSRVAVTPLCTASGVPPTTALRYLTAMEANGVVVRSPDPTDRRRAYLSLSVETTEALDRWVDDLGERLRSVLC